MQVLWERVYQPIESAVNKSFGELWADSDLRPPAQSIRAPHYRSVKSILACGLDRQDRRRLDGAGSTASPMSSHDNVRGHGALSAISGMRSHQEYGAFGMPAWLT